MPFSQCVWLDLSGNAVSRNQLQVMSDNFYQVENLILSNCGISVLPVNFSRNLSKSLVRLDLGYNKISSMEGLDHFVNLRHLNLCHNRLESFEDVIKRMHRLASLETLDFRGNPLNQGFYPNSNKQIAGTGNATVGLGLVACSSSNVQLNSLKAEMLHNGGIGANESEVWQQTDSHFASRLEDSVLVRRWIYRGFLIHMLRDSIRMLDGLTVGDREKKESSKRYKKLAKKYKKSSSPVAPATTIIKKPTVAIINNNNNNNSNNKYSAKLEGSKLKSKQNNSAYDKYDLKIMEQRYGLSDPLISNKRSSSYCNSNSKMEPEMSPKELEISTTRKYDCEVEASTATATATATAAVAVADVEEELPIFSAPPIARVTSESFWVSLENQPPNTIETNNNNIASALDSEKVDAEVSFLPQVTMTHRTTAISKVATDTNHPIVVEETVDNTNTKKTRILRNLENIRKDLEECNFY